MRCCPGRPAVRQNGIWRPDADTPGCCLMLEGVRYHLAYATSVRTGLEVEMWMEGDALYMAVPQAAWRIVADYGQLATVALDAGCLWRILALELQGSHGARPCSGGVGKRCLMLATASRIWREGH